MPPAIAIVGAAAAAAAGAAISGATIIGIVATAALTGALAAAQTFLTPKPKTPELAGDFGQQKQDQLRQFRNPVAPWRVVYGEDRVGGAVPFMASSGNENQYLHEVVVLASHEVEEIGTVFFNDYPIYDDDLDGSGNVTSGRYTGKVRIKKHLGSPTQTADADLVSEVAEWTNDHRLRGRAYIYVRMEWDADLFTDGEPTITAIVKGKKVTDVRTSPETSGWTHNAALCIRDYLTTSVRAGGMGATASEIDDDAVTTAANICEEFVDTVEVAHTVTAVDAADDSLDLNGDDLLFQTGDRVKLTTTGSLPGGLSGGATRYYVIVRKIRARSAPDAVSVQIKLASSYDDALAGTAVDITSAGSGTHTVTKDGEPRYACDGTFELTTAPDTILRDLAGAMAGRIADPGGVWTPLAGAWRAATVTYDEADMRGRIASQTRRSRSERFNAIKGEYSTPISLYQPIGYPEVTSSTFETEDNGERIYGDLDLPFTKRGSAAQRIAKIFLFRHRNQTTVNLPLNMTGLLSQSGDTIAVDNTVRGYSAKTFEVEDLVIKTEGEPPAIVVDMKGWATDSGDFAWVAGTDEQSVNRPARTTLPDPFTVSVPSGMAVATDTIKQQTGDQMARLRISWTAITNQFVTSGGHVELQVKESSAATWEDSWRVDGSQTQAFWPFAVLTVNYDVRIRAVNYLGAKSDWANIIGYTAGASGAGASNLLDYGSVASAVEQSINYGSVATAVDLEIDFGSVV